MSGNILCWCHALKELHLTSHCLFYGPFVKLVCFAGRELASGSLWQVAGQSCGLFACFFVCVCVVLRRQRGQPCNPMRAPTHRTNKVEVYAHLENTDQV